MSGYAEYTLNTPVFRGSFVNLIEPKKVQRRDKETGKMVEVEKRGLTMLFASDENLSEIKELATKLMTDKFGDKSKWPKAYHAEHNPNGWRVPWRKQWEKCEDNPHIDKSYDGFGKEGLFINATSNNIVECVDQKVKELISKQGVISPDAKSKLYSGAYFKASITLFWYDNESKGIGASLGPVQFIKHGDPLGGGGISAAEAFSPVDVDEDDDASSVFDEDDEDVDPMA